MQRQLERWNEPEPVTFPGSSDERCFVCSLPLTTRQHRIATEISNNSLVEIPDKTDQPIAKGFLTAQISHPDVCST